MKKILLLGGSAQQIVAIETAKRLGYYTVLCDYLPDNPGQHYADKFYLVSTTDKETVLEVAKRENIDGVLAYASDPAAPTAAYVAEKLSLPGSPYQSVELLSNKDRFRAFLAENGFCTPKADAYSTHEVDAEFPIPLSQKVDLNDLATKFYEKANLCCRCEQGRIIAMVAGYLEHTTDSLGYISLVATTKDARRKGYSSKLLEEFLGHARNKGLHAVHVYTHASNIRAVGMYRKVGFADYHPASEPHPEDHHFIYYL